MSTTILCSLQLHIKKTRIIREVTCKRIYTNIMKLSNFSAPEIEEKKSCKLYGDSKKCVFGISGNPLLVVLFAKTLLSTSQSFCKRPFVTRNYNLYPKFPLHLAGFSVYISKNFVEKSWNLFGKEYSSDERTINNSTTNVRVVTNQVKI